MKDLKMADPKEIPADANGVPLASARKKVIAPLPEADELVIVMILDKESGQQTYNYVDPTTALQCDRLAHDMRVTYPDGRFVMSKAQEWGADKYVRETVSAGYTMWPAQGYLVVKLEQLGILGPQPAAAEDVAAQAYLDQQRQEHVSQVLDTPATPGVWPDASVTSAGPVEPLGPGMQMLVDTGVLQPQTIPEAAVVLDPQTYTTVPTPPPAALVLDPSGQYAWDGIQWVPYAAPVPPPPPMPPAPPVPPAPVAALAPVPDATVLQFPPQAPPMPPQMPAPAPLPAAPVAAPPVPAGAPVPPPLPGLPGVPPLPPAPTPN